MCKVIVLLMCLALAVSEGKNVTDSKVIQILANVIPEADTDITKNITTKLRLPEEMYWKAHSYITNSKAFKGISFEGTVKLIDELDTWEAPEEIQRNFPYFLAGYDYEDRPVWMAEVGKYNVRKWVERGDQDLKDLEKYCFQATVRIMKSMQAKDREGREIRQGVFVGDCEGLDMTQVAHIPTVVFVLTTAQTYRDIIAQALGQIIVINANYVTQIAADLARPLAGKLMENVEIYGTNKAKWSAELRRLLPDSVIPSWYGGSSSFKPLQLYG
ncbi:unnamed protein product [Allacma fusca]|uniref:CRAL-TRIO domain-containing protein n=1 Tax=Allacma fusca TaxID=39272 RepID=A0A8J2Q1V5_9HEXA|nr:unnamed protein product [Allacma fusca]